jgi:hypothetical protein
LKHFPTQREAPFVAENATKQESAAAFQCDRLFAAPADLSTLRLRKFSASGNQSAKQLTMPPAAPSKLCHSFFAVQN